MKTLLPLVLSLSVIACSSTDKTGSVEWVDFGDDPMQNPAYMEAMAAAGTPGAPHEVLTSRAGRWKVDGKTWMAPGTEPMPMVATARTEVILGGRYVVEEFKSDFMGQPFEGRLTQGYDNVTQRYWSMWTDSMSTSCWVSYGTEVSPGVIEFRGTANDILTPNGRPTRMTTSMNEDGSYTMRMYDTRDGSEEFQSMELHYTRV